MGFECNGYHRCECSSSIPLFNNDHGLSRLRARQSSDSLIHTDMWIDLVEDYVHRSLTYSADIFPALQGLAKRSAPGMGNYYAGHWETTLAFSLTWSRSSWSTFLPARPQNPENWRAPSCSWASVEPDVNGGHLNFLRLAKSKSKSFVKIPLVTTVPVGDDAMGQISAGTLVLAGRCLLATLEAHWKEKGELQRLCIRTSGLCLQKNMFNFIDRCGGAGYHTLHFDYDFGAAGPYQVANGSRIFLMKVTETQINGDTRQRWLVFRLLDAKQYVCDRIGMIELCQEDEMFRAMNSVYDNQAVDMEITVV